MRSLQAAMLAAIQAGTVRPVIFYQGVFSTGTLYLWSGYGSITWNGQTWTGAGGMMQVGAAKETADVQAVGFSVSLNGESQALLAVNLEAAQQGLDGTVWLGTLDSAGAVIVDPAIMFKGRLDVPDVLDSGDNCTLSVSYESRLIDLQRARIRRYTNDDQHIDHPSDDGFGYVSKLQDATVAWGGPGNSTVRQ